ncbi:hypothetical protein Mpsy_0960 [Methanolobus psychrophilus R15]|nr:hypothetical protein Mpsy_0960 [Methanolobus psychrophilus R15]
MISYISYGNGNYSFQKNYLAVSILFPTYPDKDINQFHYSY